MVSVRALRIRKEYRIFFRVLPFVALLVLVKLVLHRFSLEVLSINAIFSGLIGANVFLMGFLLSGVLSDYKESERIPGELSAILATLADEMQSIHRRSRAPLALAALEHIRLLGSTIHRWLHKQERSSTVMNLITGLNDHFLALEPLTQANFIASTTTILLLFGLALARIEPFYESLFFVVVVSYLLLFLMFLIRDLDNPFGYYEGGSSEDVSLKPLEDALIDLESRLVTESKSADLIHPKGA